MSHADPLRLSVRLVVSVFCFVWINEICIPVVSGGGGGGGGGEREGLLSLYIYR